MLPVTNNPLALCAGCKYGTIKDSEKPYCQSHFAPGSSYCKRLYHPYDNNEYMRHLLEQLRTRVDLRKTLLRLGDETHRVDLEIERVTGILLRYGKCPEWRRRWGYEPPNMFHLIGQIR